MKRLVVSYKQQIIDVANELVKKYGYPNVTAVIRLFTKLGASMYLKDKEKFINLLDEYFKDVDLN